ncbi:protein MAIN-LIKE 1-like [Vicia villosa]|uniref:protein MAIN-LIKE 1-like n=1 Tax=Vicia villosa TaxID=3911 RepID=UPI00273BF3C5|nr:protein MAIN-LIKE 1-like [Vicia villosa]
MLDASLLSAFIKRWDPETSSFHLPFGEMTVNLDDVDALFHLLIASTFFTLIHRDHAMTVHMVLDASEVDEVEVLSEFGETQGFHLRMSWLRRIYEELVDAGRYQDAARAYMLHLGACTLFANKSGVYIDVCYLSLFSTLNTPCWAWEVAALMMLYMTLDVASRLDTGQLAGYLSLLQCWIYEHFLHICERKIQHAAAADAWYVRCESHVARHLPKRCLRQDDYIQGIPHPVPEAPAGGIDRWFQSHIISSPHEIIDTAIKGHITCRRYDVPGPSRTRDSSNPPPPSPPPPAGDHDSRLQFISVHLDSLMGLVNPDGEVHSILARLINVAHGGPM